MSMVNDGRIVLFSSIEFLWVVSISAGEETRRGYFAGHGLFGRGAAAWNGTQPAPAASVIGSF